MKDPFGLVFITLPTIVVLSSIVGIFLFKKWFVMPLLTFVVFIILTFTVFNESFFIWVVVYTVLSAIVSLIAKSIKK
ncbi:DUF2651 family protein [Ornithinibacillus scapharcae]|uniref:DUF2651 family protein n=1 Tax=Ornithinibacillus scapharcae TaxID=1147159 RepID=UPI000225BD58|nr:DUF2651 family protein [Ornithinibacillus scapharcae]